MNNPEGSLTSAGAASLRAAHQLIDAAPHILADPVILRLLEPAILEQITANAGYFHEPRLLGLRSHIILRSRYTEDRLSLAYQRGIRQYVQLGAGLDTFAWRRPAEMADLLVIEADHPATQEQKRQRLTRAGMGMPDRFRMAPVDFAAGSPATALREAGLDATRPAFVSSLGVFIYLDGAVVDTLFRFVASLPAGSEFVFTFGRMNASPHNRTTAARVAEKGEPWRTFHEPEELREKLAGFGYRSIAFLEPAEAAALYYTGRPDGLPVPEYSSIAIATV